MSSFLKTPNDTLSLDQLHAIAGKYTLKVFHEHIPDEIYQNRFLNDDGVAALEKLLKDSNHKLRMYGSANELAENLKIYRQFPGMDKFFNTEEDLYCTNAVIYKSLSGGEFICKSDLFLILQNMTMSIFPGTNSELARMAIMGALKLRQKENPSKQLEFVKYDQQWFHAIEEELQKARKVCYGTNYELETLQKELDSGNFKNILSRFKSIADKKNCDADANDADALGHFKMFYKTKDDLQLLVQFLLGAVISTALPGVIDKRPEMFLPCRPNSGVKTLRVFEVENEKFVMKAEFFNAVKHSYKDDTNENFFTMNIKEVEEKYGAKIKDLEFIQFPILRAKHRAVPIQEPLSGDTFCILAVDGFFDFVKSLIFGIKVFQKRKISDLNEVFKATEIGLLAEEKNPYFISMIAIEELKRYAITIIKNKLKIGVTKDVRNAKMDGFTVQNLKNELAHLELLNAFPEIQNHAEIVYSEVVKNKKEKVLRTCDLFDAIEHCQLICILDRLPNYKKFLHNQNGCHRVYGYKCWHCENQKTSKIENLEKQLAEMKLELEKTIQENRLLEKQNQKLEIENSSNSVSKIQISRQKKHPNPDTVLACTSNRIQCLICDCHVDSSNKDDVIRCPLCKRRFHQKCAFEWLKEHTQCPACNGDLPKI